MTLPYYIILETDQLVQVIHFPIESVKAYSMCPLKEIPASTLPSVLTNECIFDETSL